MPGGRPRNIRSQRPFGVGGHVFSEAEVGKLLKIGELHGLHVDNKSVCADFIDRLHWTYKSYLAYEQAAAKQVSIADEWFDRDTIIIRAKKVLLLIESEEDLIDPHRCLKDASELALSLGAFPMVLRAYASDLDAGFMTAKCALEREILSIRIWQDFRLQFIEYLNLLITVCQALERPKAFTKRCRSARHSFEEELANLYLELLHPIRIADWRESRENHPDEHQAPPVPHTEVFPRDIMKALGVSFEVKKPSAGVSG